LHKTHCDEISFALSVDKIRYGDYSEPFTSVLTVYLNKLMWDKIPGLSTKPSWKQHIHCKTIYTYSLQQINTSEFNMNNKILIQFI